MTGEIIDTHPHVFADATDRYPIAPVGGVRSRWSQGIEVPGEFLIKVMDAAGVARAVLVQTSTVYGFDNRFVADTVAAHPDRFDGVCSIDPLAPDAAEQLTYWVRDRGLVGVRLFTTGSELGDLYAITDPGLDEFWSTAEDLRVTVDVQVKYASLATAGVVARRHPTVPVVIDHLGGAPIATGPARDVAVELFRLSEIPNIYVKFSGHNLDAADDGPGSAAQLVADLAAEFGGERVLWGSNFPNTFGTRPATAETYRFMVDRLHQAVSRLGDPARALVLGGAAEAVYRRR